VRNTKFKGKYQLKRQEKRITRLIKEAIQIIDVEVEERRCIRIKYLNLYKLIDMKAQNTFNAGTVTTSMIKCAHSFNHYATHDRIINYGLTIE